MIKEIQYENKVAIQNDESIANINKVTDSDMNEIKEVVNNNANESELMQEAITNIKTEQQTQNTNISNLQTDNTTTKQDITNIKSEQITQNKYIQELEAENARLKEDLNGLPTGQASGESIDLVDSAEMRLESFQISGNSKQETRSGKNKLKFAEVSGNTVAGVTYTVKDNEITLNGTATSTTGLNLFFNALTINGQYTFLVKIQGTYTISSNVNLRKDYGTDYFNFNPSTAKYKTATVGEITVNNVYWQIISGNVYNNLKLKFQLAEGVDTEYEDYGVMPSSEYSSDIECCGDTINLYDIEKCPIEVGTLSNDGNNISKVDATTRLRFSDYYFLKAGNYVISFSGLDDVLIYMLDSNKEIIWQSNWVKSGYKFTLGKDYYIQCLFRKTVNTNVTVSDIKELRIVEGVKEKPYTPYGQGYINEVIENKNLLKITNYTEFTWNGVKITGNKDGSLTLNGTATAGFDTTILSNIKLKAGTYTHSVNKKKSGVFFSLDNVSNTILNGTKDKTTFTLSSEKTFSRYILWIDEGTVLNNEIFYLQLEEGSTVTEFEPYKSQIFSIPTQQPFRSVGDTRDIFIKKDGKRFERHYIERCVFTGGENWNNNFGDNLFGVEYIFQNKTKPLEPALCNRYKYNNIQSGINNGTNNGEFALQTGPGSIFFKDINYSNVESWKTKVLELYNAGIPLYVDYILSTPVDIECTEEQSRILDEIDKTVKSYKGVTHFYSTDNVSSIKTIVYRKDLDTMINNLNTALVALGGVE